MADTVDIRMPALGQSVAEGTVVAWLRKVGDTVTRDESLVAIETDKAQAEIPAPESGTLIELLVKEGATVEVGTLLGRLAPSGAAAGPSAAASGSGRAGLSSVPPAATAATASLAGTARVLARTAGGFLSPAVRRLARERGLSAAQVQAVSGSGRGGRVTHADLTAALAQGNLAAAASSRPATGAPSAEGDITIVPMTGMRLRIAEHMLAAKRNAPHVNTVAEVDVSAVDALRKAQGAAFKARHGFSLSWNAFLVHATARALAEYPQVNAILDERGIVMHSRVHLGMAVALEPSGLVVPVIRDAHLLTVRETAVEAQRLAELARARKLSPDDMAGGTCTLTNPGVFGNLFGTPIIHQPQAAIVDFGAIKRRVVVLPGDAIAVRPLAFVVLAWDHRVMDGATAARFLQRLVRGIETFPTDTLD